MELISLFLQTIVAFLFINSLHQSPHTHALRRPRQPTPKWGCRPSRPGGIPMADPAMISERAKKRGLTQIGTMGSGNHYTEIQACFPPTSTISLQSGKFQTFVGFTLYALNLTKCRAVLFERMCKKDN